MALKAWNDLPKGLQKPEIRPYYEVLSRKKLSLKIKRIFDFTASALLLLIFSPIMIVLSILITLDSPGGAFYRQERVTTYGRIFRIHKFRTMVSGADKIGTLVTVNNDRRVTKIGSFLRKYRLDEIPQLIDIMQGNMSFVGCRPEVPRYVKQYTPEMRATLLLPAGLTSEASIRYKDEAELMEKAEDADKVYVEQVLPGKMEWNLKEIKEFSLINEAKTLISTIIRVVK